MLALSGSTRIFVYNGPVDMRKGFEGLSVLVEEIFSGQLTSGACFVFLNKRRDRMKVIYWDIDGLVIWYKRLEKGRFVQTSSEAMISRREFFMLLEGITPKVLQKRYNFS